MRTRSLLVAIAISVGIAVALPCAGASAGTTPPDEDATIGGIGVRLTEAPVSAADDPRARIYIVDHLAPGTTIERGIEVSNTSDSTQHVVLYAAAATIDDGEFVGAAGTTPNDLSSWTSITPAESDIASQGVAEGTVRIAVPSDAAPGEQYAVVWVEARSASAAGGGVVQVSRVGIRLYVSVGPGGPPAADFEIDSLTAGRSADGLPTISASVHNTGGRALDLNGTIQLTDGPGGLTTGEYPADVGRTLALGDTRDVSITLDAGVPAGPWNAHVTLKSGLTEKTVEASITFPESGVAAVTVIPPPDSDTSWLLPAGGAVALLVAPVLVLLLFRHRPRRRNSVARQR